MSQTKWEETSSPGLESRSSAATCVCPHTGCQLSSHPACHLWHLSCFLAVLKILGSFGKIFVGSQIGHGHRPLWDVCVLNHLRNTRKELWHHPGTFLKHCRLSTCELPKDAFRNTRIAHCTKSNRVQTLFRWRCQRCQEEHDIWHTRQSKRYRDSFLN